MCWHRRGCQGAQRNGVSKEKLPTHGNADMSAKEDGINTALLQCVCPGRSSVRGGRGVEAVRSFIFRLAYPFGLVPFLAGDSLDARQMSCIALRFWSRQPNASTKTTCSAGAMVQNLTGISHVWRSGSLHGQTPGYPHKC